MMKTLTAWLILCCGLTGIACAQGQNPKSFTFTANSQCLIINTDPSSTSGVYIDVSGTFSLTLQPAASVSGSTYKNVAVVPTTSQTQQATITAVGGYNAAVAGPDHFEVCTTGYVSGSAVVTLSPTTGVASNTLGGGGGGSGTVTNVATTSPVTGGPITGTGTIGISGVTAEQGNGAKLQLSTGTTTLNDCVKFDANGNTVDAGAACGSGGGANAALSNLSAVSINTSLLAQTGADIGGTSNPFRDLYLFGSGTYGSTYFHFTGTPTSTRTWTVQDASDTFVGRTTTDTLTNKSIAGSEVNSGTVPVAQIPTAIPIGSVGSAGLSATSPVTIASTGVVAISGVSAEQGNGAKLQLSTGTTTTNDCVKFDANGNTVDAGSGCGGAGANTALSNLASVAVNLALLPGADNSISLDGLSNRYINMWLSGVNGWTNGSGTADTGLSRDSAGVVDVGNGTAGNSSGTIKSTIVNAVTGYQVNGAATNGNFLAGNGTNFVSLPPGVIPRASTCTANADTVLAADRAGYVSWSDASACAVTLPQAGSANFANNFVFVGCDIGAGTATITPTTSTISYTTGSAYTSAASTLALTTGQCAWIYSDNTNYFAIVRGSGGGSGDTITSPNTTLAIGGSTSNTTLDLLGAAGKIFAGSTPALTFTPALGVDNSNAGTLQLSNGSANAHTIWGSAATTSNTILGFATAPTTGHIVDCTVASTTCTLHDSGIATASVNTTAAVANPPLDKSGTGLSNPTADATFTYPIGSTTGLTLAGTAPASVSTAIGTNATSLFNLNGVTGGADSNATGTAGIGSTPTLNAGAGGAGTGTNAVGGAGGNFNINAGNGGASLGTGINSFGGNIILNPGTTGTGGSGTAGKAGVVSVTGPGAGFVGFQAGTAVTTSNTQIPGNTIIYEAPTSVTAYTVNLPSAAANGVRVWSNASNVVTESLADRGAFTTSLTATALPSGTVFLSLGGTGATYAAISSGTETSAQTVMPFAGTFNAMYAHVSAANGSGQTIALTMSKNAATQTVTCTIAVSSSTCNDTAHSFTFVAGDLITIKMVDAGTSTTAQFTVSVGYF